MTDGPTYNPRAIKEDDPRVSILNSMVNMLGWSITHHGNVEYLLSDVAWRCRTLPEYSHLGDFPAAPAQRLGRLRSILASEGPLSAYRSELVPIIDRLAALSERRHFIAHGYRDFQSTKSGEKAEMRFCRFVQEKDKAPRIEQVEYDHATLDSSMREWRTLDIDAKKAIGTMYFRLGWEQP